MARKTLTTFLDQTQEFELLSEPGRGREHLVLHRGRQLSVGVLRRERCLQKNDESAVQGKEEAPDSEDVDQELTRPASSAPGPNSREVGRDLEFADAPSDAEDFAHFVEELAEAPSEGSLVIQSSVWNFVEEAAAPGPEGWADSQ